MKLADLIKSHHWLSVETTLLSLYPDQMEIVDAYRSVFESLVILKPVHEDMLVVLTEYACDSDEENTSMATYVDVSGRKRIPDNNSITDSFALEFVKWENWMGMDLAPETMERFGELEIIAHCLHEMTFCGYKQEDIQEQLSSINKMAEEAKKLTAEERNKQTISLEEVKKMIDKKSGG